MSARIRGCVVTAHTRRAWERVLVFPREPVFVTESAVGLLPPETVILERDELAEDFTAAPLELRDSYWTYAVGQDARRVALLAPAEWRSLPSEERAELRGLQWRLGRGQLYDWSFAHDILRNETGVLRRLDAEVFEADGRPMLDLTWDIWWAMSRRARAAWLARYVGTIASDGEPACLSSTLADPFWAALPARGCGPAVRVLAGTFAGRSGPNCFAAVLAGVTNALAAGLSAAQLWLHGDPFLRNLRARGFERQAGPVEAAEAGDVLIWEDGGRDMVHAALCLGDGLAFQKQGQGWALPWQVVPLAALLRDWAPGAAPTVWARRRPT
jgi:hypothetical protein